MPDVVGVIFHKGGKVYSYAPASLELVRGDLVVVPTQRGVELGEVVVISHDVPEERVAPSLKEVVRKADEADLETRATNEEVRREALAVCRELIAQHGLDMKLVDADVLFDGGKIVFSFFAEERVDFRALVSDLARHLKTRIELRQIGAREEARVVGGLGPCGRGLCCTLWQGDQEPVSIRMAKEQSLPLNPMKISGLCGRLMCCLKYEQEQYVEFRKAAPRCGTPVECSQGEGVVIGYQVPKDTLTVRLADGSIVDEPVATCSCGGAPCRAGEPTPPLAAPSDVAVEAPTEAAVGESADATESAAVTETGDAAADEPVAPDSAQGEGCDAVPSCDTPAWEGVLEQLTPAEERQAAQSLSEETPEAGLPSSAAPEGEGRKRPRPRRRRRRSGGGRGKSGGNGAEGGGSSSGPAADS
jgi:cell fate regulator YaaT (PSP1 superfamily)